MNYRTPAEIMAVAADVLAAIDPERSCRARSGRRCHAVAAPGGAGAYLGDQFGGRHAARRAGLGDGRLAVIVPAAALAELADAVSAACPTSAMGEQPELDASTVVLEVAQSKGLEFDSVLIADPGGILASHRAGGSTSTSR